MNDPVNKESTAIQAHINMLQGIISRMANNSANCKTWAITIVSAILVLYADEKIEQQRLWVCYIPICLFFFLDCYYLGLERQTIKKQSAFINKVNSGENITTEIFSMESITGGSDPYKRTERFFKELLHTLSAVFSFSTLPFYVLIMSLIYYLGK